MLGAHAHLARAMRDEDFEHLYKTQVKPFVATLYKYPKIPASLHYSGVLLAWIEKAHPEFCMLLEDLVSRKQIELLGGGFYEPLLPLVPLQDKIGQIELLTTHLRRRFGKRPQGCLVPAQAWEQNLVGPLTTCGMAYTFLPERRFPAPFSPCLAEDQGKLITVFPASAALSRAFAGLDPVRVLESLLETPPAGAEARVLSVFPKRFYAGEGGSGPGEAALHSFFDALSAFEGRFEFTTPAKIFKNLHGLQKVYFTGSTGRRAGLPRQCLIDRAEANGLYAKMLFTHILINQLRGDKERKQSARRELWKAQAGDAFYEGAGGGIYRSAVRKAAYKALLSAEKITRENGFTPSIISFDFDLDGEREALFQGEELNCYIHSRGASVFELDYLPKCWNYLDTFAPERGSLKRNAFADRLSPPEARFAVSAESRFCSGERFSLADLDRERGIARFRLAPRWDGVPFGPISLEKTYRLADNSLFLRYTAANQGREPLHFNLSPVIDLSFPGDVEPMLRISPPHIGTAVSGAPDRRAFLETRSLLLQDIRNGARISLCFDRSVEMEINSIVLEPEHGPPLYQSTCITPLIPVSLAPGAGFEAELCLCVGE